MKYVKYVKYEESYIEYKSNLDGMFDSKTICYLLKIKNMHGIMQMSVEDIERVKEKAEKRYTVYGLYNIPEPLLLSTVSIPFPDNPKDRIYARYMVFVPRKSEFNKWFLSHSDKCLSDKYRLNLQRKAM